MLRALAAERERVDSDAPIRLLLVEDNPADSRLLEQLLEERGGRFTLEHEEWGGRFTLEHVSYLAAGLAVLEAGRADIVLADLTLPDSRGLETVEALLARAPEVPVVVLTGVADEALAVRAVRSGAQDYLVKGKVDGPILGRALRYAIERKSFENALQKSRQRFQALFDHALDAILLVDGEGRFVAANPAAETLTGYRDDELTRLCVADLTRATDQDRRRELWDDFVSTGKQRGEYILRRRDGTEAQVAYRSVANIQPGLHLSFLEDLSERRRAEEENRQHAERLRLMMEQLPAVLWTTDRDLRFTSGLGAGLAAIGRKPGEEGSVHDLWPGPDADRTPVEAHLQALQGQPVTYVAEYGGRCFHAHVEPFRGRQGEIVGVIGVALDVTERHAAEAALRESEERYRRFFFEDLTGDAVATPDGRIVTCNPAFAEIFGFATVDEALRATLPELFPDEDLRREFMGRIREEGKLERFEMTGRRRNGEDVFIIANVIATFDAAGELVDLRGYLFDDTDRRQTEQQLRASQKMDAVGRLAGGVAHDFNNLVTAITGYSELLLARLAPGARERRELEEIRRAGDRAAALTRQLLAFSRSQVMRPTVLDLNDVVAGTQGMLQRLLGEDVRLFTALAHQPVRARADRGQIEQVILNLVVNARDAMPLGGELTLETALVELDEACARKGIAIEPGPYALLAVTDTGEGMPAGVVERVFEPFFTTKEPGKGTGLGLSTAYGIVKQSGGYIFAYSEPGEGTTFRVYLPRVETADDLPSTAEAPEPRGGRGETVLVVEDEDAVRALIVQILRLRGYSVLEAPSGEKALALCREEQEIDLVITDVVMPDMRGPELAEALAEVAPDTRVLFISGYPGGAIVRRGELSESMPFLQKPFTHDELIQKVRDLLDRPPS